MVLERVAPGGGQRRRGAGFGRPCAPRRADASTLPKDPVHGGIGADWAVIPRVPANPADGREGTGAGAASQRPAGTRRLEADNDVITIVYGGLGLDS
jgi:hypothetical protein